MTFETLHYVATMGDPDAQFKLGVLLKNGEGMPKDLYEAIRWFNRLADHGSPEALSELGDCYRQLQEIPNHKHISYLYYELSRSFSEKKACPYGMIQLGVHFTMNAVNTDIVNTMSKIWKRRRLEYFELHQTYNGFTESDDEYIKDHCSVIIRLISNRKTNQSKFEEFIETMKKEVENEKTPDAHLISLPFNEKFEKQ